MPKTRSRIDKDEKTRQILDAGAARLREGGYEALSVASLARDLGIAANTIYWYFPSKDHLFVATVESMLLEKLARKPRGEKTLADRVLWFVDQLAEFYPLRVSMNERAPYSPVVGEFVEELDSRLRMMLLNALTEHVDKEELQAAVDTFIATVQGSYVQEMPATQRRKLLRYSLTKLTDH
jgi:AcrR family transcriptional regulator